MVPYASFISNFSFYIYFLLHSASSFSPLLVLLLSSTTAFRSTHVLRALTNEPSEIIPNGGGITPIDNPDPTDDSPQDVSDQPIRKAVRNPVDPKLLVQQKRRTEAYARKIPIVAHVGLPTCPSYPYCHTIPQPMPSDLPPEVAPLPFQNVPGKDNRAQIEHPKRAEYKEMVRRETAKGDVVNDYAGVEISEGSAHAKLETIGLQNAIRQGKDVSSLNGAPTLPSGANAVGVALLHANNGVGGTGQEHNAANLAAAGNNLLGGLAVGGGDGGGNGAEHHSNANNNLAALGGHASNLLSGGSGTTTTTNTDQQNLHQGGNAALSALGGVSGVQNAVNSGDVHSLAAGAQGALGALGGLHM